jgi:hypothetical protein
MDAFALTDGGIGGQAGILLVLAGWAVAGVAALIWRLPTIRGTTLVAPWCWSLLVLMSLTASEIVIGISGTPALAWTAQLRFAAAMTTICPVMALLGAKRPQNIGWQFVVISLFAILCLPSIEWLLFGGVSEIHSARFWFLTILIALGVLNGLPTRFWPSSLLYSAGQAMLLVPFLNEHELFERFPAPVIGLSAIVLAWLAMAADWPRPRTAQSRLDRVWLDFRDSFGAVWALRVAERMNASSAMYGWPVTLAWRGFQPSGATAGVNPSGAATGLPSSGQARSGSPSHAAGRPPTSPDIPAAVEDSLRTLLRRFVSSAWIDERLGPVTSQEVAEVPTA